jgi:hypothetical protein
MVELLQPKEWYGHILY